MSEQVRAMLNKITADVEDRVAARQDDIDQAAAALSTCIGPLATAHKLAEMAKTYFDIANHGVPRC